MAGTEAPLLTVEDLAVTFATDVGDVDAVRGVSWTLLPHETVVVLGESGSGKSVSLHAIAGLLPRNARTSGSIHFKDQSVLNLKGRSRERFQAESFGMIFQDPMSSLNPCFTVGDQIAEILRVHRRASRKEAWSKAVELLDTVRIDDPPRRAGQYPHELSGGMRQRVMIAMAIALEPPMLLADEPTTSLDTTVRGSILTTMQELRDRMGMGIALITHDIGVAAAVADRIAVMYAGKLVEYGSAKQVLHDPAHPYTAALLASLPRLEQTGTHLEAIPGAPPNAANHPAGCAFHPRCRFAEDVCRQEQPPLIAVGSSLRTGACHFQDRLKAEGALEYWRDESDPHAADVRQAAGDFVVMEEVVKEYRLGTRRAGRTLRAVDGVSLRIPKGRTLGLVGESGSGKSTTAMMLAGLTDPTAGRVFVDGVDLASLDKAGMRRMRRNIQIVFQDPFASMDPRMSVAQIVEEPLLVHKEGDKAERHRRVENLLDLVGLDPAYAERYPHQVSGGQAQRVALARALALEPALIILDEPVASLDLSIQAQILNLMRDLQHELGLTYLFIGHDLAAVAYLSDEVAVMQDGKLVEQNAATTIYKQPREDYTRGLLDAVLDPEHDLGRFAGSSSASSLAPTITESEGRWTPSTQATP